MAKLYDLQALGQQLLVYGVKPRHVRRTLSELQGHYQDLHTQYLAQGMESHEAARMAQAALGEQQVIAQAVLSRPELLSWSHRFPKSVYVLAPLLIFLLVLVTTFVALMIAVSPYRGMGVAAMPGWFPLLVDVLIFLNAYLMAPLLVAAFGVAARQRMMRMTWPIAGMLLLAFVSAGQTVTTVWPLTAEDVGSISVSWGYRFLGVPISWEQTAYNSIRLVLTLLFAAGVYVLWPQRQGNCLDFA